MRFLQNQPAFFAQSPINSITFRILIHFSTISCSSGHVASSFYNNRRWDYGLNPKNVKFEVLLLLKFLPKKLRCKCWEHFWQRKPKRFPWTQKKIYLYSKYLPITFLSKSFFWTFSQHFSYQQQKISFFECKHWCNFRKQLEKNLLKSYLGS